jgi:tRNA pseudouridine38-40 synthase
MRYVLTLAYEGTRFAGWQRQSNALAVQQLLEEALAKLTGESVRTVGAGRTDAGVHAEGQAVSLALRRDFPPERLLGGLNHHLPADVRVRAACRAPAGFDARRDARAKVYRYRLATTVPPPPRVARFVVPAPPELDPGRLAAGARALAGRHDFAAFALAGGAARTSVRRIFCAAFDERPTAGGSELVFRIAGEGFLRGMVRSLVGTLIEVGTGRRSLADFASLLAGGERGAAGPTAPARGLCLERVDFGPPFAPGSPPPLW